jgi:NTE family protein
MKSFALALGAGGARGLAHIAAIEAFDEMGVTPAAIAGSSLGALVGAAYAAGLSGKALRRYVIGLMHDAPETRRRLLQSRAGTLTDLFAGAFSQATQMDAEKFCAAFLPPGLPGDFAALKIPLIVVATDLHGRCEAPLVDGALGSALAASIAFPGLFRPVDRGGQILVDGGATNPLPVDQLRGRADIIVAIDVLGKPAAERSDVPGAWESIFTTIAIMGAAIVAAKNQYGTADLVIRPQVSIFRTLDFAQASAILRSADAIKAEIKEKLGALLSAAPERNP